MKLAEMVDVVVDEHGIPTRLRWRGEWHEVTDQPTRREPDYGFVTHPQTVDGCRFQVTDAAGESLVVDVVHGGTRGRILTAAFRRWARTRGTGAT